MPNKYQRHLKCSWCSEGWQVVGAMNVLKGAAQSLIKLVYKLFEKELFEMVVLFQNLSP